MKTNLGGDRLGSGNKNDISMRNYERSTHDMGYVWRSTLASGTLVPFMKELALPGDSFDINLACDIMTLPTVGPLFGSYKVQLDVFTIPIRLYNRKLMQNTLNIGLNMASVKLPQIELQAQNPSITEQNYDSSQINSSCILNYLDIRGLGIHQDGGTVKRKFNAIPLLAYWSIYKQYYANKQEEIGAVIHNSVLTYDTVIDDVSINTISGVKTIPLQTTPDTGATAIPITTTTTLTVNFGGIFNPEELYLIYRTANELGLTSDWQSAKVVDLFGEMVITGGEAIFSVPLWWTNSVTNVYYIIIGGYFTLAKSRNIQSAPQIETFPLTNIDDMMERIMRSATGTIDIDATTPLLIPYTNLLESEGLAYSMQQTQEGLGLKTYQSDLYNNWISTEWIDGDNGINAITAIDTTAGSFNIDTLNLSNKLYDMFNRIAISGGSYDDWLESVYTHERVKGQQNPTYVGGLSKELIFQEVTSTTQTENQPLGTLAGKGRLSGKNKGGKIMIRIDEPSYIMGIISLTPRIDYSQGNKFDVNLKTLDDLHKPALDEIGFQDLITDQMAWWDTKIKGNNEVTFKSAGKQPAWLNYMTNVNVTKGNFADINNSMFMTLNRRYEANRSDNNMSIKDLTTYIDPTKYNNIFAETNLDAQNFWTQISVDITARRKMSAKIIPNL